MCQRAGTNQDLLICSFLLRSVGLVKIGLTARVRIRRYDREYVPIKQKGTKKYYFHPVYSYTECGRVLKSGQVVAQWAADQKVMSLNLHHQPDTNGSLSGGGRRTHNWSTVFGCKLCMWSGFQYSLLKYHDSITGCTHLLFILCTKMMCASPSLYACRLRPVRQELQEEENDYKAIILTAVQKFSITCKIARERRKKNHFLTLCRCG